MCQLASLLISLNHGFGVYLQPVAADLTRTSLSIALNMACWS